MSLVWWLVVPAPSLHCHNQSSSDFLHKARNRLSSYTCALPPTLWQNATTECSHCQASSFLMGKYWQNDIVCLDSVHGCASFFLTNRYVMPASTCYKWLVLCLAVYFRIIQSACLASSSSTNVISVHGWVPFMVSLVSCHWRTMISCMACEQRGSLSDCTRSSFAKFSIHSDSPEEHPPPSICLLLNSDSYNQESCPLVASLTGIQYQSHWL